MLLSLVLTDSFILRFSDTVPDNVVDAVIGQLKSYISTSDIPLLSHALTILALLLQLAPSKTYPAVESGYLPSIYTVAHSPLLTGTSLDSLLSFFARLVQADSEIATHVIPSLTIPLVKTSKGDASYSNVAKCIRVVVECHPGLAAGTTTEFSKALRVSSGDPGLER